MNTRDREEFPWLAAEHERIEALDVSPTTKMILKILATYELGRREGATYEDLSRLIAADLSGGWRVH